MAEIDFSPIGNLYDTYRQARMQATREQALAPLANSTDAESFDRAARGLLAGGDLQGGMALAQLAQKYGQRQSALKLSESFGSMFGGQPQQAQQPTSAAPATDQSIPRGMRNNNPLNIEAGDFTQSQPGFAGSDGRFARFQQPQQGVDAAGKLLDTYSSKYGLNTISGIIARWAPQGENDTRGYAASVAGRMGVNPDQPIDLSNPQVKQSLIAAMAQFENGRPLASPAAAVAPAAGAPTSSAPQAATPWPAAPQPGSPQAPQAMFAGKPVDQWVKGMTAIATHPDAPPEVQKFATEFVKGAMKESGLTTQQKDYGTYVQQGGKDDFTTWERKNKTAGATMINTAEGQDAAQMKARIAIDTHAIQDLSKKAVAGRSAIPLLDQVFRLADKTPGGWAGQASPVIARAMSGMGLPVSEGMSNAELLNSVSRQFIPSVRDPGSTSNYEQQLYQTAVPGLAQSVEGRQKIARMFKAQIERNNDILQIYRQNVGSPDLDKKLAELDNKPMFAPEDRKVLEQVAGTNAGGASAAQASPGSISEGATATNKATGQKIMFKGGQWVPVQ